MNIEMKKILYGSLAVLAMSACSGDELVNDNEGQVPVENQDVSIVESAIVSDYDMQGSENLDGGSTRAGIDGELNATWSIGDELSITDGTLMFNYDVTATTNGGKGAVFKVAEGRVAHISDGSQSFYAMYPRRSITEAFGTSGWNGAVVKGQIFAQQSYKENMGKSEGNNFGGYYVTTEKAAVSTSENGSTMLTFSFSPLASVIDVDLTNTVLESGDAVAAVYVRDLSGGTIAANFSYDCGTKTLTSLALGACDYNYSSRSDVIGVNFYESEDASGNITYGALDETNKVVRFYLLPVKLGSGVEITVRTVKGKFYTKKSSASVGTEYTAEENGIKSTDSNFKGIVKPFYKKYNFGGIEKARKGAWMACVPQNIFLHKFSVPGSHDSPTSSVSAAVASVSKTQNITIAQQLELGVRAFDLRPKGNSSTLELYHGITATGVTLSDAVNAMTSYLTANPSECIFAIIHREGDASETEAATWSNNVYNLINQLVTEGNALEALTTSTRFSACRGKIIFIYRDDLTGSNKIYNAAKVAWSDNIARTINLQGTDGNNMNDYLVSYQDIYDNSSQGESNAGLSGYFQQKGGVTNSNAKVEMVKKYIDFATANKDKTIMFINFASYAGGALSTITSLVSEIMPSVNQYIAAQQESVGIIFSDYVNGEYGGLVFNTLMIDNNFKHVFNKRNRVDVIKSYTTTSSGIGVAGDDVADDSQVYSKDHRF